MHKLIDQLIEYILNLFSESARYETQQQKVTSSSEGCKDYKNQWETEFIVGTGRMLKDGDRKNFNQCTQIKAGVCNQLNYLFNHSFFQKLKSEFQISTVRK
ncbi:hypothetical protein TTHERM_00846960 (macronuclear) [Tetrahymena thermophila SB210]|uniref:Uncharacterized protein n=1 Tax=Tetrahymena thermophila (strain SB210) TaxID=312017 RepID=Q22UT4_TETTS|nr:hypothetical protein TTHERM_00846960 [Tetrahymena thermophila SB210]EAR89042.1 hypothetical protein TTHERM_00846960 [Tetrahymena thermophila SB210]|eukprot:XP_001009287.1 hypothetical protein TTHERM_00846960 [Tetrahymena thermophila SB210]